MDAVILAAGRGSRLEGVAAPFWKPLTVVNGEPLILKIIRQVFNLDDGAGTRVVVVSPENAQPITQLIVARGWDDFVNIVVQPTPSGPGDAYLRAGGFFAVGAPVMIVAADNVISDDDLQTVAGYADHGYVIGTGIVDGSVAQNFTLVDEKGTVKEGGNISTMLWKDRTFRAWLGPLIVPNGAMRTALSGEVDGEVKIGANLQRMCRVPMLIPVTCYDIGVV